jgi:hypothetical protein
MGYYINQTTKQHLGPLNKADALVDDEEAIELPFAPDEFPTDRAIICVVNNGSFEAAGFAYDKREMDSFNDPDDWRPKRWLVMDLETAKKLSGYSR